MITLSTVVLSAAISSPPSGRPPMGPLERHSPRVYEVAMGVRPFSGIALKRPWNPRPEDLSDIRRDDKDDRGGGAWDKHHEWQLVNSQTREPARGGEPFPGDGSVIMPLITQGSFSAIDVDSLDASMRFGIEHQQDYNQRCRLDDDPVFHQQLAILPMQGRNGRGASWSLSFRAQAWNSRIDDQWAQQIRWPHEWPEEVRGALEPQKFIESNDPIFRETVDRLTGNQLRMVPPYLVAKELVRYCINELRITSDGQHYAVHAGLIGMEMVGAKAAAEDAAGSPHDLVCVCVAILRAAGIPARPVVGFYEDKRSDNYTNGDRDNIVFLSWGEFYLPDTGWVPFDPNEMRKNGMHLRNVFQPWAQFGTMNDLNKRVPMSHGFVPSVDSVDPYFPAIWGWESSGVQHESTVSVTGLEMDFLRNGSNH